MMHIKIHYGGAVTTVPAVDSTTLARATADDLRVLLCLCASASTPMGETMDELCASVGKAAGCGAATAAASIAFWRGTGVLALSEATQSPDAQTVSAARPAATAAPTATPNPAPRRGNDRLPSYTNTDLADLMEAQTEIKENIDECNRIWGNLLNLQEVNTVLGLSDYLGLDWDYILSLIARCVEEMDRLGIKHSMRYVEKQAIRFYDEGITTLDALQEKFRALDVLHSAEGKLRRLFGMGERGMTPSETKFFSTWLYDFQFDYEIIEMAYNIAVDTKGTPSKPYINSILANWNSQNLRTVTEIEASQAAFRTEQGRKRAQASAKTGKQAAEGGSFDTENFFDAAVRRSLGDKTDSNS